MPQRAFSRTQGHTKVHDFQRYLEPDTQLQILNLNTFKISPLLHSEQLSGWELLGELAYYTSFLYCEDVQPPPRRKSTSLR